MERHNFWENNSCVQGGDRTNQYNSKLHWLPFQLLNNYVQPNYMFLRQIVGLVLLHLLFALKFLPIQCYCHHFLQFLEDFHLQHREWVKFLPWLFFSCVLSIILEGNLSVKSNVYLCRVIFPSSILWPRNLMVVCNNSIFFLLSTRLLFFIICENF